MPEDKPSPARVGDTLVHTSAHTSFSLSNHRPHSYLYSGLTAVFQPDFQVDLWAGGTSGWCKLELRLGVTLPRTEPVLLRPQDEGT